MKNVAFAGLLLFCPLAAIAGELCDQVAAIARHVMTARQNGEPMEVMMKAAKMQDGEYAALVEQVVIDAYNVDLKLHRELKDREITEFGNRNYKACLSIQ